MRTFNTAEEERRAGALEERVRIRRELLEEVTLWTCWDERAFRRVLDEICPEEEE